MEKENLLSMTPIINWNMFKILINCILILFVFVACTGNKIEDSKDVTTIKLVYEEGKVIKQSDFMESRHVILLEDTDEKYIGEISKLYIVDSLFIIEDQITRSAFFYTQQGKLISKIQSHGRGKGEYASLNSTWLNYEKKEFAIYDNTLRKILLFNLKGEFVREFPSPGYINRVAFCKDYAYYFRSNDGFPDDNLKPSNLHLLIQSPDSVYLGLKKDFFMYDRIAFPWDYFVKRKDAVLLLTPQENHIYELSKMDIKLKYRVKLSPNPLWENENYLALKTFADFKNFKEKTDDVGKLVHIDFMGGDRYLLFAIAKRLNLQNESSNSTIIYDTENNQKILSYEILQNDIDGFTNIPRLVFFNDSLWINYLHQYELDGDSKKAIEKMYNVDFSKSINQILIISKLKFND
jgi:hypothetical protein